MKYCLIGEKLGHSYSKIIHEKCGLDYSLIEIEKDKLKDFFENCEYDGFNVTIPYKKEVMKYLSYVSPDAQKIGAVNTVLKKDGKFYGYNTDVGGLKSMIESTNVSLKDKNVLVLGSGGASNTACTYALNSNAKSVKVVSRKGEINYENCYDLIDTDIIINATPCGMSPNVNESPINLSRFNNLKGVYDCIYNPQNTNLILQAKKLNIPCASGLKMLVVQALLAQDIWLESTHTKEKEQNIFNFVKNQTTNIVLAGMPSSGKTTIAKALSERLNLKWFDSDEYITKTYFSSPSEIILKDGEKAFRDIESDAIAVLSQNKGAVISIGGGGILRQENVINLKRNGVIFYVDRPLELLIDKDRPLSKSKGIETLYNERKDKYNACCDFKVKNDKDIESVVREIILKYENISY
ncbi:MAG: AAA family ATPase [Clostridia bacterium]|nr:AAA family ATPase [Clostridia bacterium]